MINLVRNYKTYITELLPNNVIGEYALVLNDTPNSDIGYLLLEPGTIREESIFYHRAVGNTVYIYQENRTNPFEHADNSICLLANSIDYMNYLIGQSHDQCFIYKIGNNDLICKGGKFYINGTNVDIPDLDTSLELANKTLVNGGLNYIYIVDNDFKITQSLIPSEAYLVATVDVGVGGAIVSITKHKTFIVGNKGEKGDKGDIGNKGDTGNGISTIELVSTIGGTKTYRINFTDGNSYTYEVKDGEVLSLPNYTISNTTTDRSIDANNTTAEEVLNVLGTLYNDIKLGLEAIGSEGRGIVSVNKTNTVGLVDTYTITYTDATTSTFNITNGVDGIDGVGINNIALISTVGKVKTYRITFTNATTFDFIVTDGADGTGGDMYKSDNLSGLVNVATARTNLDVYSKSEVDGLIPTGGGDQKLLRKVVAATGGDYTSIQEAFTAGEGTLYIKGGTYEMGTLSTSLSLNNHIDIVAEDSCIFNIDLNTANLFQVTTESNIKIKGGKWNITLSNSGINNYNLFTPFANSGGVRPLYYSLESLNINLIKTSTNGTTMYLINTSLSNIYYNGFFNINKIYLKTSYGTGGQNGLSVYYNNNYLIGGVFDSSFECNCSDTFGRDTISIQGGESFFVKGCLIRSNAEPSGTTNRLRISLINPIGNILYGKRNILLSGIIENNYCNIDGTTDSTYDYGTTNYRYYISGSKVSNNYFEGNFSSGNGFNITSQSFIGNECYGGEYVKIGWNNTNENQISTISNNRFTLAFGQSSVQAKFDITDVNTMFSNNQIHANYLNSGPAGLINISGKHSNIIGNTFKKWGTAWTINNTSTGSQVVNNLTINI